MVGPDVEAVLQQIAYVADELESLSNLVDRVPEVMLTTQPTPSDRSVAEMLVARYQRDQQLLEAFQDGGIPADALWEAAIDDRNQPDAPSDLSDDLPELLRSSARLRRDLVERIAKVPDTAAPDAAAQLAVKLYGLVHADAEMFGRIASLLYSGPVTGRDKSKPSNPER